MVPRLSKSLLVLAVAFFYTLVVFNNTTDYNSNYQFVRHILQMDSTFPGNHGMWRAINQPAIHTLFYLSIITWETITAVLCWWCGIRMLRAIRLSAEHFHQTKTVGIIALTLGMLMWFVAFLSVGGEWFLMWQSKSWNGQDAAFRMFVVLGIVLLYLSMPEPHTSSPKSSREI
jgi:predicted small integral membrane protein